MLHLVATPIGNLNDISERALEQLRNADYILCEDTRHTRKLLNHYSISAPLKSYHQFSEAKMSDGIIEDLKMGKEICLVSDAGTPAISDPGEALVSRCHDEGIAISAVPGPSALIMALSISGLKTHPFTFWGFLPKKSGELKERLITILFSLHTSVCYVPPQQLKPLLALIAEWAPDRELCITRELTKHFEQVQRGSAANLQSYWEEREVKGEIVLLVAGNPKALQEAWGKLSPQEQVEELELRYQLTKKEALALAAKLSGVPKRDLYASFHKEKK